MCKTIGDRFELKNNTNVNNEAYSKAPFMYRASYTQQSNTMPFHGLYSNQADKLLKQPYSFLGNKTENTFSLRIIIHSYRIYSYVKSYVRVAKSEIYFMEAPYSSMPVCSLSVLQSISFSFCKSSQLTERKYGPLFHVPNTIHK